jgi:hypothetical protein
MVAMRGFVSPGIIPLERKSQVSDKGRWGMSNESCKKLQVTLSTGVLQLGVVSESFRANIFGRLSAERLFSCIRRACESNGHFFLSVTSMPCLTSAMTTIRAGLGLSRDLSRGVGARRRKHGDAPFQPPPPGYDGLPMCRLLALVLVAKLRSGVRFPKALLVAWAGLDVLELPESEPCFIEDLVDIGQERRPLHATLRNARSIAFGGLGQCKRWASARQVAHAADGLVDGPTADALFAAPNADGLFDAPTPPALERPWPSHARTADEPLFPFHPKPPE